MKMNIIINNTQTVDKMSTFYLVCFISFILFITINTGDKAQKKITNQSGFNVVFLLFKILQLFYFYCLVTSSNNFRFLFKKVASIL